jgi:hypothetical protein
MHGVAAASACEAVEPCDSPVALVEIGVRMMVENEAVS